MNIPALKSVAAPAPQFTTEQIELIKSTICKGSSDDELRLFLYQAGRTGLDPLARQIYSIERREYRNGQWVKARSIQTSIDGFRLIAERSGKYAGQVGPYWCGADGQWMDVWVNSEPPAAARVGILRSDFKEPCWGVARFDAYAQKTKEGTSTRMWKTMGDVMVAKCAEALALRKAFPQELSGLYTGDEMMQAESLEISAKRENPHVTKPEDIIEPIEYDESGEPVDNIPRGDASIERMSKAMARPEYALCQTEIRNMKTLPYLMEWGKNNANRIESLPTDWQEILRGVFRDKMTELGWKKEAQS